jgi:hypothetical protein
MLNQWLNWFADLFSAHVKDQVATGLILVGSVAIGFLVVGLRRGRSSLAWPQVEGIIAGSTIKQKEDGGASAYILYEYCVGGCAYKSSIVTYDAVPATRATAETIVAEYPERSRATVFYNPKNPSIAVLRPGVKLPPYLWGLSFCVILMSAGILLLFGMI